jgi:hypothetical protein
MCPDREAEQPIASHKALNRCAGVQVCREPLQGTGCPTLNNGYCVGPALRRECNLRTFKDMNCVPLLCAVNTDGSDLCSSWDVSGEWPASRPGRLTPAE